MKKQRKTSMQYLFGSNKSLVLPHEKIMFDELKKYKNNGHFFFKHGDKLINVSKDVPQLPGVYYIIRLSNNKVDLIYIAKSGTINQNGKYKGQRAVTRRQDQ